MITFINADGVTHEISGDVEQHRVVAESGGLGAASGWVLKPVGLCRGEVCVPLLGREVELDAGFIDVMAWAAVLGQQVAVDVDHAVVALAPAARAAADLAPGSAAPELELTDIDGVVHRLSDQAGHKRVLVTWASWCGCRHEVGAWSALQDELADAGLSIYSVAFDEDADAARPWIEAGSPSYPVVIDQAHVTAERFGITNVPSTVWIDEDGRVVKPATISPGDDQFKDFTKIDSARHHDALRRWVRDGELPDVTAIEANARTSEELLALAEQRIGAHLHRIGKLEAAQAHLAKAVELAPWDWTVRRAAIAMRGEDPFLGEEFVAFWQEWDAAGRPGYGPMSATAETSGSPG